MDIPATAHRGANKRHGPRVRGGLVDSPGSARRGVAWRWRWPLPVGRGRGQARAAAGKTCDRVTEMGRAVIGASHTLLGTVVYMLVDISTRVCFAASSYTSTECLVVTLYGPGVCVIVNVMGAMLSYGLDR